ncbi:hypothetical protein Pan97_30800 [Bremerella volcania]|uniref:Uncharacterized protein n=1 Tax=Bremerella volcania TaxID=2527984 RepID=A0A518C9Z2_9BACT|nr:hypothetical protein [Bremerella volcania]QDU76035.1 hypothetical protein Pan97_30800 [Bremerella volcania]
MSLSHEPPEHSGQRSTERAPQVVVRAGKTFVCSSCGTLVEVPADVVGQLVIAVGHSGEETHIDPAPSKEGQVAVKPSPRVHPRPKFPRPKSSQPKSSQPKSSQPKSSRPKSSRPKSSRPRRPQPPKRVGFSGEMIDGLNVPSAKQLDRALAWVSFHLKVLDRQGSEMKRLRKLLKQPPKQPMVCDRARRHAQAVPGREVRAPACPKGKGHAPADQGRVPGSVNDPGRGPP